MCILFRGFVSGFSSYLWLISKNLDVFLVYEILMWIVEYVLWIFVCDFFLVLEIIGLVDDLNEIFVVDVIN